MIREIPINSSKRIELIDITGKVQEAVSKSGIKEGICVVYSPHTTAAVIITENADPSVQKDVLAKLNKLAPANAPEYTHMEGNSDSHIKSAIIGNSRTIIVKNGKLLLGVWEGCMFAEFDGPRNRNLLIKIVEG